MEPCEVMLPVEVIVDAVTALRLASPVTVRVLAETLPPTVKTLLVEFQLLERCSMLVGTFMVFAAVVLYEPLEKVPAA